MKYVGYIIPVNGSGETILNFEAPDNANDAEIEAEFYKKLWSSVTIKVKEDKPLTLKGATRK